MKLWLLRPEKDADEWVCWYDKCFGFVIAAETEGDARRIARESGETGDEGPGTWQMHIKTTCECIAEETHMDSGVIIRDFASA